jgi:hypothetical protein
VVIAPLLNLRMLGHGFDELKSERISRAVVAVHPAAVSVMRQGIG